ncbi:MAG TPA: macrolide ABC transporter ATP-binding protein, partial [Thermoanaerobaculia bacterium]|nr:macrolide ABC transporter ATP-binding protein [Thermoanaerobaculia bacterium]
EKQRVCLARAVVTRPGLVLADEPTGNLDSASGAEIVALLEGLHATGITLLVVTHDAGIGGRARRRVRLADGRVAGDEAA